MESSRNRAALVVLGAVLLLVSLVMGTRPVHAATQLCGATRTTAVNGGEYIAQNNVWGATTPQCISVDGTSFTAVAGCNRAGSRVASGVLLGGATWDVWYSRMNWNYIAYVRTSGTTAVSGLDLRAFTRDAVTRGFDQMCDPNYGGNPRNNNHPTGALPDAPLSGHWFSAQFHQLMQNAYPPLS